MQIKLAFFEVQKVRIVKVLETWGNMMWTSNKHTSIEKKWAWSFSILIVLTLVMYVRPATIIPLLNHKLGCFQNKTC